MSDALKKEGNEVNEVIEIGDVVDVKFSSTPWIDNATVLYVPMATGDCWHLRKPNGKIVYVQNFDQMELVK